MRVLVTGANGFVGHALMDQLALRAELTPVGGLRSLSKAPSNDHVYAVCPDLDPEADWSQCVAGIDVVVHCAARAHLLSDDAVDPIVAFRRINTAGTLKLAQQAAAAGVKHFVFISSIGVNGAQTFATAFDEHSPPAPHSPYAISKHEAEIGLFSLAENSGMTVSVVRPPLVYGPGAPGNLARLTGLIQRGLPLPLASVQNKRTLISLTNLVDLLVLCATHPAAPGEIFLAGDPEDVSTADIVRHIARGINKQALLIPFPVHLIDRTLHSLGKGFMAQQLFGSLQVDASKARRLLSWSPPVRPDVATWA